MEIPSSEIFTVNSLYSIDFLIGRENDEMLEKILIPRQFATRRLTRKIEFLTTSPRWRVFPQIREDEKSAPSGGVDKIHLDRFYLFK